MNAAGKPSPAPAPSGIHEWPCPDCGHVLRCATQQGMNRAKLTHPLICPRSHASA